MALIESLRISTHRVVQVSRVAACFSLRKCLIYLLYHFNVSMKCAWTAVNPDWLGKTLHRRYPVEPLQSKPVSRGVALSALNCLQEFPETLTNRICSMVLASSRHGVFISALYTSLGWTVLSSFLPLKCFPSQLLSLLQFHPSLCSKSRQDVQQENLGTETCRCPCAKNLLAIPGILA